MQATASRSLSVSPRPGPGRRLGAQLLVQQKPCRRSAALLAAAGTTCMGCEGGGDLPVASAAENLMARGQRAARGARGAHSPLPWRPLQQTLDCWQAGSSSKHTGLTRCGGPGLEDVRTMQSRMLSRHNAPSCRRNPRRARAAPDSRCPMGGQQLARESDRLLQAVHEPYFRSRHIQACEHFAKHFA